MKFPDIKLKYYFLFIFFLIYVCWITITTFEIFDLPHYIDLGVAGFFIFTVIYTSITKKEEFNIYTTLVDGVSLKLYRTEIQKKYNFQMMDLLSQYKDKLYDHQWIKITPKQLKKIFNKKPKYLEEKDLIKLFFYFDMDRTFDENVLKKMKENSKYMKMERKYKIEKILAK